MIHNFAAFILTHGRADGVITDKTLRKCGYTGKIYYIVDDMDDEVGKYRERFGDDVIVFDKAEAAKDTDHGDNFGIRGVVYARNKCFDIAEELGVKYFIQLDDDYSRFSYKFDERLEYQERPIKNLDRIFDMLIDYYIVTGSSGVAMAQNGDFIGGGESGFATVIKPRRKCMNTFVFSTDRRIKFCGAINEDVNMYVSLGAVGKLFFTIPLVAINQGQTQMNSGGLTEFYLDIGTYVKSFYTVMYAPSCTKISSMGDKHKRLHHRICWRNAVPVIIDEKYRRVSNV